MAGATELSVLDLSFKAEQSFAASQYLAAELSGDDQVDVCDAATDLVIGVIQNNPLAGQAAQVRALGVTKWVSDGSGTAIVVGDRVGTSTAGKCVKKTAAGDKVAGIALGASTTDGAVIDVLLTPAGERST